MQRAFAVATLQDNLRRVADVALRLCASALKIILDKTVLRCAVAGAMDP